ncbi:hypothetical protein F2Q69_00055146 [Brassica cretica]|uniref:Uncharacterized protein n=1 Tax=Brassica cretica TaxID=69181 RepID=A0A8S9MWA9_BRACR|nr:hypothetical protein F2Q69_00055146 [Brassica cretica]
MEEKKRETEEKKWETGEKKIVIAPTPTKKQKKRMERSRKELKGYLVAAMALIDMVSDKLKADELKDYLVGAMTPIGMVSDKLEAIPSTFKASYSPCSSTLGKGISPKLLSLWNKNELCFIHEKGEPCLLM